jgi:drug/metabolite transporter (DMT)-like permease
VTLAALQAPRFPAKGSEMSCASVSASASVQPPHDQNAVLRGLGLVVVAMIVLPGQDAIAKYVSDTVSPGQIAWARFLLQTAFTLPFLLYFQGPAGMVPKRFWPNMLRGALIAASSTLFFIALKFMPMADAIAIFFVEPFILTVLSAVIDKEEIGWQKRVAVVSGFIGVLIVVRPSYDVFGLVSLILPRRVLYLRSTSC